MPSPLRGPACPMLPLEQTSRRQWPHCRAGLPHHCPPLWWAVPPLAGVLLLPVRYVPPLLHCPRTAPRRLLRLPAPPKQPPQLVHCCCLQGCAPWMC